MPTPKQKLEKLLNTGQWAEAGILCSGLCKKYPHDARLWYTAGGIEKQLGNVEQALVYYRRAAGLAPDMAQIYVDIGWLLYSQGNIDEARSNYEQAHRLGPDLIHALLGLINVWVALDRLDDAIACFRKALSLQPDSYELYCDLGLMLESIGRTDEAYAACQHALELNPDYVPAIALKSALLRYRGCYQEAFGLIDPLVQRDVKDVRVVQEYLDLCHRVDCCDEAIALAKETSSGSGVTEQDLMCLYFSTGHALDRVGRYNEAFEQFVKANRFRGDSMDVIGMQNAIGDIKVVIDADPALLHKEYNAGDPGLVFIIGMPRSGTTLAEQILSSHPDVYGAGEITAMQNVAHSVSSLVKGIPDYPRCIQNLDESGIEVLRQAYLSRLPEAGRGSRIITDKQLGNFLYVGLIRLLFPDAPIISCTRDPLDTCVSCYFHNFRTLPFTYDLVALGKTWREYRKLMDHWHGLSIPMMDLRYESLVDDVEGMIRKLLAYCGLDWDDRCLRFHESGREVATVSKDQVNQPVYKKSVGRWRNYEAHLSELKRVLNYTD